MPPAVTPPQIDRFAAAVSELAGDLSPSRRLGLAVSGGPDSLALLLIAAAALPGGIAAATVDHGLRTEAAREAAMVANLCTRLGVPHRTLPGSLGDAGSVQEEARRLRYRLLGAWAGDEGLGALATAHHRDDQAETFLMRAVRGAGVGGLAGVRSRVTLAAMPVPVVRPLLDWSRSELSAIIAASGVAAVDDPSNRDPAYDRTAFRALLGDAPLLRPGGLAAAAAHLADADEAIGWIVERLAAERLVADGGTVRLADPAVLPRELRRRLVHRAIQQISGEGALRGAALDRLMGLLESGRSATLAGVLARPGSDWRFSLAPPRADRPRNRDGSPAACIAIDPEPLI
jgi:tRNA(Ile)-lysidine synthase